MAQDDDFNLDDLDTLTFESFDEDSENDPDQYGVYVKSGPEDIDDGGSTDTSSSDKDALADEDFLNTDELANLDDALAPGSAIDLEGESVDDFSLEQDDQQSSSQLDFDDSSDMAVDIDLSEFISTDDDDDATGGEEISPSTLMTEDQSDDEFIDIDIEVSDSIADEELEIIGSAKVQHQAPSASGMTDTLDEISDDLSTSSSRDDDFSNEFDQILAEEKSSDISFDDEVSLADSPADTGEVSSLPGQNRKTEDQSRESSLAEMILKKIETELASIKSEISDLKSKLANIKSGDQAASEKSSGTDEETGGGFFSEDEDEVIALTGDELDSILSSADLTSETAIDSSGESPADERDDLLSLDEQGNISDKDSSSDIDLLQGTDLESSLNEDLEIPSYPLESPIPGGSTVLEEREDASGVPDSITLEDEPTFDTHDLDSGADLSGDVFQDLSTETESVKEEEIDFANPASTPSTVELVDETEDVTASFFSDEPSSDSEESISLEIPFDDELLLDDEPAPQTSAQMTPQPGAEVSAPTSSDTQDFAGITEPEESAPVMEAKNDLPAGSEHSRGGLSEKMKEEIKSVLSYMDKLLASLPDEKIQEFAESEHFEVYKKLFEELGLTE